MPKREHIRTGKPKLGEPSPFGDPLLTTTEKKGILESDWNVAADPDNYGTFIIEPFRRRQSTWPFEVDHIEDENEQERETDRRLAIVDKEEEQVVRAIEAVPRMVLALELFVHVAHPDRIQTNGDAIETARQLAEAATRKAKGEVR
jgi:hypothetical protein